MITINIKLDELKLSHELNISLTGILSGAELLSMTDQLSLEQKEQIEVIRQAGNRLLHIVSIILNGIKREKATHQSI